MTRQSAPQAHIAHSRYPCRPRETSRCNWPAMTAMALLAFPVHADPMAFWGGSSATLSGCHEADACVTVINRLTGSPDFVSVTLTEGGLRVEVEAIMGSGTDPDRVRVIAPVGCIVLPPVADIPEDGVQVFRIFFPLIG